MIAQRFDSTVGYRGKRNTSRVSDRRILVVESKIERGFVFLVRKADQS